MLRFVGMEEKYEKLGQLIDRIENIQYALNLQIPAEIHLDAVRGSLPEIVKELKASFIEITGNNPWD